MDQQVKKSKPKTNGKGRPKGSKNKKTIKKEELKNSKLLIDPERIFTFIKKETIPVKELDRFLQLCNIFANSLGSETLNDTDIEEIALIYRDRIYMDLTYQTFAEANAIDTTMVNQIEKINKSLEVRKSNLGSRFIDRDKMRKPDSGADTFLEIFSYYAENKESEQQRAEEISKGIDTSKGDFTNTIEYMENKLKNKSNLESEEEI